MHLFTKTIRSSKMKTRFTSKLILRISDTWMVFTEELRRIFHDPGVLVLFFLAPIAYPILYNYIYIENVIRDVPVAVVDMDCSPESRLYIHQWDATPEVKVAYSCTSMEEAEHLLTEGKVHGILYFPEDFNDCLHSGLKSAHLSLYCDMSSFLYMKNVYMSANQVMLDKMYKIQVDRYRAMNMDENLSWAIVQAVPYEENTPYNPTNGYGAFLIPAVLMLIIHQTLIFGISMLSGTAVQENREVFFLPGRRRRYSVFRILLGRGAAYFTLYMAICMYVLVLVPQMFGLPHVGSIWDIIRFIVPYLLATIYFGMMIASVYKQRETGMMTLLPTSLIFLFISGVSWPIVSVPRVWRYLGDLFPYTWGVHGFLNINTAGATLYTTIREYIALWLLAAFYFGLCCLIYMVRSRRYEKRLEEGLDQHITHEQKMRELQDLVHETEDKMTRDMERHLNSLWSRTKHAITRAPED